MAFGDRLRDKTDLGLEGLRGGHCLAIQLPFMSSSVAVGAGSALLRQPCLPPARARQLPGCAPLLPPRPNRGALSRGGEELAEEQALWRGMLPWERGAVLAPGIHHYPCRSSTKHFRAIRPRSIFTRYLRSINMTATASYRDLLLSACGGDRFTSGLGNELFQGVL